MSPESLRIRVAPVRASASIWPEWSVSVTWPASPRAVSWPDPTEIAARARAGTETAEVNEHGPVSWWQRSCTDRPDAPDSACTVDRTSA
jgi:hypothetical protein